MSKKRYFQMPDIDAPDPEPGFQHSSDEFIVPPVDEDGGKVRVWATLPAKLHAWVGQIVTSRKFPFRYESDLVRYAIYLGCVQLCRIDKSVPNLQGRVDAIRNIVNRRMAAASIEDHIDHLVGELEKLRRLQAWGEILYLLAEEKRAAQGMVASEPYWGQRWVDAIRERCGDLEIVATSKMDLLLKEKPNGGFLSLRPSDAVHFDPDPDAEEDRPDEEER